MSMLSSMTEKMRDRAHELQMFAGGMDAPYIVPDTKESTRISMLNASGELRDAADTIDYLCNTCNDLQRDYDNLRKAMWDRANARAIDFMEEDELRATCADLYDYIDELKELMREMLRYIDPLEHQDTCGIECPAHKMCTGKSWCKFPEWAVKAASDLGVEVDE